MATIDQKIDASADLFAKMNSIPCGHVVVNPNIDSPYDHYIEFVERVHNEFSPEQIRSLIESTGDESFNFNGSIPLSVIPSLAFNRLKTNVEEFMQAKKEQQEGAPQ